MEVFTLLPENMKFNSYIPATQQEIEKGIFALPLLCNLFMLRQANQKQFNQLAAYLFAQSAAFESESSSQEEGQWHVPESRCMH